MSFTPARVGAIGRLNQPIYDCRETPSELGNRTGVRARANRSVERAELIAGHADSRDFIYRATCAMGVHVIVNEPVGGVVGSRAAHTGAQQQGDSDLAHALRPRSARARYEKRKKEEREKK